MVEKWRDLERILPRTENPLKCLKAWGSREKDVRLVLQDDDSQEKTTELAKDSINLTIDKKHDLINRSVDCRSLENITAVQERKLTSLSRALEILDFQLSCWDDSDEKFLYLTEDELVEDFSLKLSQTVKLQAKELNELPSLQTELNELQQTHEESTSKLELYSQNFSQFESEIEDTDDVVEKLLIQIKNYELHGQENLADVSADMQNEIRVLQLELEEQNRLSIKQDEELETIQSSVSELTKAFHLKTKEIERLSNELTAEEVFYDLDEHFRPLSPEEEPYLYRQSLSSDSVDKDLSNVVDTENIAKEVPDVNTLGSNTDHADRDLPPRSSSGSPEEFFRNWSCSSKLPHSPLNYFPLKNGVKTSQSNPARLSTKSKIDSQSSERKWENGKNKRENVNGKIELPILEGTSRPLQSVENSVDKTKSFDTEKPFNTSSSTGKDKFPLSMMQNERFSEGTKAVTSSSTIRPSTSSSHRSIKNANVGSASHVSRENFAGETKFVKGMRKDWKDKIFSVEDDEKEDILAASSTMPKPVENTASVLGYQNAAKPSIHPRFKSGSEIQVKTEKLPPATFPKPWTRKISSGSRGTTGTTALVFKSIPGKAYLLPPAAQHKRTHHRKEKPLSHGDLCEEGVFV